MSIRSLYRNAALAFAALAVSTVAARAELNVATTTTDLAAIVRAIGGAHVRADSLTPGASDAHFAQAKPSMIRRAHDADLLVVNGVDLEIGWLPVVLQSAANPKILPGQKGWLDVSSAVAILRDPGPISNAVGHVHPNGNPHYLLDPRNGIAVARAIAQRLAELDPPRAADYAASRLRFETELNAKFADWQRQLAPLRGKPIVTYHRSLTYLAQAFGLNPVGEVETLPGISPTVAHLEILIETIKASGARTLVMEAYFERRSAAYLAEKTGLKIAIIPHAVGALPDVKTYPDLFDAIVRSLRAAM